MGLGGPVGPGGPGGTLSGGSATAIALAPIIRAAANEAVTNAFAGIPVQQRPTQPVGNPPHLFQKRLDAASLGLPRLSGKSRFKALCLGSSNTERDFAAFTASIGEEGVELGGGSFGGQDRWHSRLEQYP